MRPWLKRAGAVLRDFWHGNRAAAVVEFTLILPVMLTLYLGSVELSSAISVDKRVAIVSGSLGDLVARADGSIKISKVDDYFLAASLTMAPYDSTSVQQIVSCIYVDADGNATVYWSRAYNGATARTPNSAFNMSNDPKLKDVALDNYVIVSEAKMSYAPLFGYFFNTAFNLYHYFYYLPRFGEKISLVAG